MRKYYNTNHGGGSMRATIIMSPGICPRSIMLTKAHRAEVNIIMAKGLSVA